MAEPILRMANLAVEFRTDDGVVQAVRGVDLELQAGEVLAVVGESGSGKSVSALSVLRLLPPSAHISGRLSWHGEDLLSASDKRMRAVRGGEIAMIFQDPLTALNPVHRVGRQLAEMVLAHREVSKKEAMDRAIEMLKLVGIPQADRRARSYPHEFSGGMRQRAMIAMALSCEPQVIIADEPTTALDVTVQAQVLDVLLGLTRDRGTAVMLITHDLGVVAGMADRVSVMYAGQMIESGTAFDVFSHTSHPYTSGLLGSLPQLDQADGTRLNPIAGQPPSMLNPPSGCAFHPRCEWASSEAMCMSTVPTLVEVRERHSSACFRSEELVIAGQLHKKSVRNVQSS